MEETFRRSLYSELDDIDYGIVRALQENARLPFTTIAKELGVTEKTVRMRVQQMQDEGVLSLVGIVNPVKAGLNVQSFIQVAVEANKLDDVVATLNEIVEVRLIVLTTGDYQLIIQILVRNYEELAQFLMNKLNKVPGVTRVNMFSKKMNKALLSAVLGTVLLVTGCGGNSAPSDNNNGGAAAPAPSDEKKVLNIGLKADPPSMDPTISTSLYDRQVYASLYDKLFDISPDGKIVPMLVDTYEVSPDGKTYTFKLKTGIKFHDGTDFNAEAVKFNFDRNMTTEKSKRKGDLKFVESVSVVDNDTVTVQLTEPFAPFLSVLTDRAGMMVSPTAAKEKGDDFLNAPVGTGPFVFVKQVKGDSVSLKKNENYWNGEVKLDEVNYKVFTNGTAKVQNLRSGMLDIIDDTPTKEIPAVEGDSNLQLIAESGMGHQGLHLNNSAAPFDNKYLRAAVDRAIDREALVKVLFNGYAAPARTAFAKGNLAYNEELNKPVAPNADEIKELLAKGGKPNGFEFKLLISTSPENEQLGAVLQNMLKQHNINVVLEKVEYGQMLEAGSKGDFQAMQLGWSGRQDPDGNVHDFVVTGNGNNYGRISVPQLDELILKARAEQDESKRKALYDEVIKVSQDEAVYAYLYHQYVLIGMNKKVTGFTYVPDGLIRTATLDKQ